MDKDYWLDRWKQMEIGFHQNETNPYLQEYWKKLALMPDSEVLIPLCGKSCDMLWLRAQGYQILGVELSNLAARSFFEENSLSLQCTERDSFIQLEHDHLQILCGDFFDLKKEHVTHVEAIYDRAALIALPTHMRKQYVDHLLNILPKKVPILLIALDYPESEMSGPPFSVSMEEIKSLYHSYTHIVRLVHHDVLEQNPRFQEKGLSRLHESVFLLMN